MLAQACAAARRLQVLSGASPRLALGTPAWGVRHLAPRPFQLPVWEPPANPEKALEIKRYSPVLFEHVGYAFLVHTGKAFRRVKVTPKMVGHKFGEFAPTRVQNKNIPKARLRGTKK